MSTDQQHDFNRPIAAHRKRVYGWSALGAAMLMFVCVLMVGFGVWPMEPTGYVMTALMCVPIIAPLLAAWWDAPGENRTTLEKSYEFLMVWFPVTAIGSELVWEVPWLIGDLLGWMNFTYDDPWGFYWSFYGLADVRYLQSDASLWGMEVVAITGGVIMLISWLRLMGAGTNDRTRINALWWGFFAVSLMVAICVVYYASEFRAGMVHLEQGQLGFWLKIIVINIPWAVCPIITAPFCAKQLTYLIRKDALASGNATDDIDRQSVRGPVTI
jgi:hypothetical protein